MTPDEMYQPAMKESIAAGKDFPCDFPSPEDTFEVYDFGSAGPSGAVPAEEGGRAMAAVAEAAFFTIGTDDSEEDDENEDEEDDEDGGMEGEEGGDEADESFAARKHRKHLEVANAILGDEWTD